MTPSSAVCRILCATLAVLALPRVSLAFSIATTEAGGHIIEHWPTNQITYLMNPKGSEDLSQQQTFDQLQQGFANWMAVGCTSVKFVAGYHCNTAKGTCLYDKGVGCSKDSDCPAATNLKVTPLGYNTNGRNELTFVENNAWTFGQYVLGVTSPVTYNTGAISESDIVFNGYNYKWTTNANAISGGVMHLLSVATHEEGHFFGVQHMLGGWNPSDPPTMAPAVDPSGKTASLNADDSKVVCFLHPKTGTYSCADNTDCPYVNSVDKKTGKEFYSAKMTCAGTTCGWGDGTGPIGKTTPMGGVCTTDNDCVSPLFCQPYGSQSFCSQLCTVAGANCPDGFNCAPYQNGGGKGACISGPSQPKPVKNPGDSCKSSAECISLMCLQNVCRIKCAPKTGDPCDPVTEQCAPMPGTGIGACVPGPVAPEKSPLGAQCQEGAECVSGICLRTDVSASFGICRAACKGKGSCAKGFACIMQAEGFEACLPGDETKLPAGSACTGPSDCASALCISKSIGVQFCSAKCTTSAECPCGMSCENTTAGLICFPGKKVSCIASNAACNSDGECVVGNLCSGGVCKPKCDLLASDNPCGAGEGCLRLQTGVPEGVCAGVGAKNLQDGCASDLQCQSLFCDVDAAHSNEKRCEKPCDPSNKEACGPGLACNALTEKVGACFLLGTDANPNLSADAGNVAGVATTQDTPAPSAGCSAAGHGTANYFGILCAGLGLLFARRRQLG